MWFVAKQLSNIYKFCVNEQCMVSRFDKTTGAHWWVQTIELQHCVTETLKTVILSQQASICTLLSTQQREKIYGNVLILKHTSLQSQQTVY